MPISRPRRFRWRRLLLLVLSVIGSVQIVYLVAVNVLLRTELLRAIVNGSSARFAFRAGSSNLRLDYRSAYSWLPGRVHVEDIVMRGREDTVEWRFTLDRADVTISLPDLLRRTFHATRVRSSGFAIRARLRLEPKDATPDVVAALPAIPGFADPPLLSAGPAPAPLRDAKYDLWAVDLEDVDVEHVREVWIHTIRARGDTRVRGRWLFRPQRWLDVGPAVVDANGVDFSDGKEAFAKGVRGSSEAIMHPLDLRQVRGLALLDHISYDGRLHGLALVPGALRLLAPGSGLDFKSCELPFDARLVLVRGRVAVGTRVETQVASCSLETHGLAFEAPVRSDVGVAGDLATLNATVSALRVTQRGTELTRVTSIAARLTSDRLQLTDLLTAAQFSVDIAGAQTSDVGAWHDFFPAAWPFVIGSGSVTGNGHAEGSLPDERGHATLQVSARRLGVELGQDQLVTDAAVHVNLQHAALEEGAFDLSGSDVTLRALSAKSKASNADFLSVPSLTATAPRFTLAPSGTAGHVAIDLPRAELCDLRRLNGLFPASSVFRVERGSGRAKLRADVELGSGSLRGEAEVVARGFRARVGSSKFSGDLSATLRAQRQAGPAGSTSFSGSTVALSNVATSSLPEAAWWGALTLKQATLHTSGGIRFDASAALTAKDATPATVVVAQNSGVPAWAANIFRMPALAAQAEVRLRRSSVEVRSLVARGGGASLRAEYANRGGRQDGALLLDLGWLDLGYDLADGATGFVLLGPQSWYERKVAVLRGAARDGERKSDMLERLARYSALNPTERQREAKELAMQCASAARSCDDRAIDGLLRASGDVGERGTLSGVIYAPLLETAARRGADGTTLDPLVVGSSAEALKLGGVSTLDHIPVALLGTARSDAGAARGKVIVVTGHVSSLRPEGSYFVGTLMSDEGPVHFVTPFVVPGSPDALTSFRGVFVQWYAPPDAPPSSSPSLVLVGAFVPGLQKPLKTSMLRRGRVDQ